MVSFRQRLFLLLVYAFLSPIPCLAQAQMNFQASEEINHFKVMAGTLKTGIAQLNLVLSM